MDISFNIVGFIESNPVAKLSSTYNNKLLTKIKENFNETQQQLFISSFYTYLNYHPTNDFVIDLDDVWKWLGFTQKIAAKRLLEKIFKLDKDYKNLLCLQAKQEKGQHGGHNKDIFMLNVKTFKLFCIKAGTEKANEIHEYFVKLEELLHETVHEECAELKQQLENQVLISQNQQDILKENTLLKQFPANVQCVYYGKTENKSKNGEPVIKFGCSNFLCDRVKRHKTTYDNFYLINAFRVDNCQHIENAMKYHPVLEKMRRSITKNNTRYTELLALNGMSYENLDTIIKDIIKKIEYSSENYTTLLNENEKLKKSIQFLKGKIENLEKKKNIPDRICDTNIVVDYTVDYDETSEEIIVEEEEEEVEPKLKTFKKIRKFDRARDGKYYIDSVVYNKLFGTREEVWNGTAYKTSGGLVKNDLMISISQKCIGKIVSKAKSRMEKKISYNRFEKKETSDN
jgi:phage anti-repressor protein